jgi:hypothetical protein
MEASMTDDDLFSDTMLEETFEYEQPTGPLLLALQARYPAWAGRIADFFEAWLWQDWCEVNLPPPPEPTPEETERFVEQAMQSFWAKLDAQKTARKKMH